MDKLQKTILYWALTALVIVLVVFVLVSINQKVNTATTTNVVSFSGEGKVSAKPDIAVIDLAIVTQATTSKAAQDANSKKSQTVVDFLKKNGVADKDIKTTGYNIYPQYVYPRPVPYILNGVSGGSAGAGTSVIMPEPVPPVIDNNPRISGYQVVESLEIKVRDLNKVSQVLDGVVAAGANQVGQLTYSIDNPEKLKDDARAKAIADAKAKANTLESQIGIRLGKIINFSEGFNGYPGPIMYDVKAQGGLGGGPSVPSGENEITVDITLTYQIK
jgi:uncharacterized protein YggE